MSGDRPIQMTTVVGARPQFVKAAEVSRAVKAWNAEGNSPPIQEFILHTGQHFDRAMSGVFFEELGVPKPDCNLGVQGLSHGAMTGRMLEGVEEIFLERRPDLVLVYGDTNSTLAGALAASKLHIPVVHVEAGLRSRDMRMPEEINRALTDRVSNLLLCPSASAAENLVGEGIAQDRVEVVGDVMFDSVLRHRGRAKERLEKLDLTPGDFAVCTFHRQENVDDLQRLEDIVQGLRRVAEEMKLVLPLHPRTAMRLRESGLEMGSPGVKVMEPQGYLDMIALLDGCALTVTDSGGLQKEAFFLGKPVVVLRDRTEWTELVDCGAAALCGPGEDIAQACLKMSEKTVRPEGVYGDGQAAKKITRLIAERFVAKPKE